MTNRTSICVLYKFVDGWHVFTSDDVEGLYVASKDAAKAYADVAMSVKVLLNLNAGVKCEITPELPVAEFFARVKAGREYRELVYLCMTETDNSPS